MDTLKFKGLTNIVITVKSDIVCTDEGVRVHIEDGGMTPETNTYISGATDKPLPNDTLAKLIHSMLCHVITDKLAKQHRAPEGSTQVDVPENGGEVAKA